MGRSRGGWTTKTHLACDGKGRPLSLVVTAGNVNDTTMLRAVLEGLRVHRPGQRGRPRTRPSRLLADKGCSSRANRELLRPRGIPHIIPERRDQANNRRRRGSQGGRPVGFSATTYRNRNVVERCFNQLKQWRGLATRTHKHAHNYQGGLLLTMRKSAAFRAVTPLTRRGIRSASPRRSLCITSSYMLTATFRERITLTRSRRRGTPSSRRMHSGKPINCRSEAWAVGVRLEGAVSPTVETVVAQRPAL